METTAPYSLLRDPEMKEILESFITESREILEELDHDLIVMEQNPKDSELLNKVFRAFHTIKGTSGFLSLDKLTSVTHRCEDILNKLRKGEAEINPRVMDAVLLANDKIRELVINVENNLNEDVDIDGVVNKLEKIILELQEGKKGSSGDKEEAPDEKSQDLPGKSEPELPDSAQLKESETNKAASAHTPELEIPSSEPVHEAGSEPENKQQKQADNNIRVDVARLDELLNIASELVLGRNRLLQVNSEFAGENEGSRLSRELGEAARQIDLMTNELQLIVMKTRMVKIGKVFNRFPRVVRDLAKETGKKVNLVLSGEETELDKTLVEEINDPLVHIIRNSIDHGIESPEERKKCGKDETGTITLSALHEGNHIILGIEDDGKGIDPEKILAKAVSKELISPAKAAELTTSEIYNLLFLPGFSTAEKVTNISGRGVGMDVVKTNVTRLRGLINIDSRVGGGTKITIKLPLTLAIIPGMIVSVKDDYFVIPLNSVLEVVRVNMENISSVNQHEVIRLREKIVPLVNVDELTGKKKDDHSNKTWQYVVVVGIAEKIFGIKVDKLIGQKEIVIKSLGNYLGNIEGIAGSTIMGDGMVIMILDLGELITKLDR